MQWTPQQDDALRKAQDWFRNQGRQVWRMFGYAGVGKTTLAKHFASFVDGEVLFAAFTGKAAHVLHQNGCPNATTIHRLIYKPQHRSRARLKEIEQILIDKAEQLTPEEKEKLNQEAKVERENMARPLFALRHDSPVKDAALVVIDECSMVDATMGQDLLSFGVPILVLGDPAQLPPVGGQGFFTDHKPDVLLTDIQRQARDNPIIRMATKVRQGEKLAAGDYGAGCQVVPRGVADPTEFNQILVGRNKTRQRVNSLLRQRLGYGDTWVPEPGEKLVCLKNNHQVGVLNGAIWYVEEALGSDEDPDHLVMTVRSEDDGTVLDDLLLFAHHFQDRDLPWWAKVNNQEVQEFTHAWGLTTHKAQGSQWPHVMVIDESGCFRDKKHRWLYTALTRASESVTVVR